MTQVNMLEAKSDLSKLVKLLESKQEEVVYLARNGSAVVQMTLIPEKPVNKRIGVAEGKFNVSDDFDKWDKEVEDMFGGEMAHPDAMPISSEELAEYCEQSGFKRTLIREKHIYALSGLKRDENAPLHKAPFDKMLICQASTENMMFVTHDSLIPGYNEPCILAV